MNRLTDQQLLSDYAERRSEAAFAELVRRHIDFVYSAALRMVRDPHLAQDVTQGVFVALVKNINQLVDCPVVPGWLHRTTQNLAANAVRSDVRRRAREQEVVVMNQLLSAHPDTDWKHIAPYLDEALGELSEPDRDAVLLRYFKNHDLRTVGATLGISDDAAQKRVSRAVERLREFFAKRGITVGASGLVVVISANAVQAAPVGLAVTIATAAVMTGTTLAATATVTATKAIAMTALQKTIITATIAVLAGAGIYEARQASQLSEQVNLLQEQQTPLAEQIRQLESERDATTRQVTALQENNERLKPDTNIAELLKLRGEVGVLRRQLADFKSDQAAAAQAKRPFTFQIPDLSQDDLPRNFPTVAWVYSGHSNPESTLATMMWAFREGNMSVIMNTLAPESSGNWEKLLGANTTDEIPEKSFAYMKNVSWFDLIGKKVISDKEVQLTISITPSASGNKDAKVRTVSVKNVQGKWRVGDLIAE